MHMKGIILAGGSGSRLYPLTLATSKQLLPVYNKPMIYYPLSVLMEAHIRDILIISTPLDTPRFRDLLGDGSQFGIQLSYAVQEHPNGIAEAFIIGRDFIGEDDVALILGDNIFVGNQFKNIVREIVDEMKHDGGATIIGCPVNDPYRFGVVGFDVNGKVESIIEKPKNPASNIAVTGLYFYDNRVTDYVDNISKSPRGELEITDINQIYLNNNELSIHCIDNIYERWYDVGTFKSLIEASDYIKITEDFTHSMVACLEEIALKNQWIDINTIHESYEQIMFSEYGKYLKDNLF